MGRNPVNKSRIDNENKKQEIADSLFDAFMTQGIKNLSAIEISTIANKSKATIYKYFKSKEEIVKFILMSRLNSLSNLPAIFFDESMTYKSRYTKGVETVITAVSGISSLFLSDIASHFPELFSTIENLKQGLMEILKTFYKKGTLELQFIDVEAESLVLQDELFFNAILDADFLAERNLNIETAVQGYFKQRFNGILTN